MKWEIRKDDGAIKLNGFVIFKSVSNNALWNSSRAEVDYELVELVVKTLNRELPGGKLRVRRKKVK